MSPKDKRLYQEFEQLYIDFLKGLSLRSNLIDLFASTVFFFVASYRSSHVYDTPPIAHIYIELCRLNLFSILFFPYI